MMPYLNGVYGNPSSAHAEGRAARRAIEKARATIAECVGAEPDQVYFTPSATAANNAVLEMIGWIGQRILASPLEHPSVLNKVGQLKKGRWLELDRTGRVDPQAFHRMVLKTWANCASVCWVCSETGVINPIRDLLAVSDIKSMHMHSDATQAVGHVDIAGLEQKPDFITFGPHKLGGPRGVGVIVAYNSEFIEEYGKIPSLKVIYGGEQERGIWPGTENTAAIIGSAAAVKAAVENSDERNYTIIRLRDRIFDHLNHTPGLQINTPRNATICVPGIVNVSATGQDGLAIVLAMDEAGIAVSSGSACSTGSGKPSAAIMAASGGDEARARGSVRFSFNETNTLDEIDYAMEIFDAIVRKGLETREDN